MEDKNQPILIFSKKSLGLITLLDEVALFHSSHIIYKCQDFFKECHSQVNNILQKAASKALKIERWLQHLIRLLSGGSYNLPKYAFANA